MLQSCRSLNPSRGAVFPFLAISLVAICICVGYGIAVSNFLRVRASIQHSTDFAVLSALGATSIATGNDQVMVAQRIVEDNALANGISLPVGGIAIQSQAVAQGSAFLREISVSAKADSDNFIIKSFLGISKTTSVNGRATAERRPIALNMALDFSPSMAGDPFTKLVDAVSAFILIFTPGYDHLGIVGFGQGASDNYPPQSISKENGVGKAVYGAPMRLLQRPDVEPGNIPGDYPAGSNPVTNSEGIYNGPINKAVARIKLNDALARGGTNFQRGVRVAGDKLLTYLRKNKIAGDPNSSIEATTDKLIKAVLIFSDGSPHGIPLSSDTWVADRADSINPNFREYTWVDTGKADCTLPEINNYTTSYAGAPFYDTFLSKTYLSHPSAFEYTLWGDKSNPFYYLNAIYWADTYREEKVYFFGIGVGRQPDRTGAHKPGGTGSGSVPSHIQSWTCRCPTNIRDCAGDTGTVDPSMYNYLDDPFQCACGELANNTMALKRNFFKRVVNVAREDRFEFYDNGCGDMFHPNPDFPEACVPTYSDIENMPHGKYIEAQTAAETAYVFEGIANELLSILIE